MLLVCATLLLAAHAAPEPACTTLHRHLRTVHSSDHCAMALRAPKVALLFLVRGELPHKELWRRWFEELGSLAFRGCMAGETDQFMECAHERRADPIPQQHLFSVRTCAISRQQVACRAQHTAVLCAEREALFSCLADKRHRACLCNLRAVCAPLPWSASKELTEKKRVCALCYENG